MTEDERTTLYQIAEDTAYMRARQEIYEKRVDDHEERVASLEHRFWGAGGMGVAIAALFGLFGGHKIL